MDTIRERSVRRAARRRGSRGATLVEFALIALPLFTILFGTIEFGWAFFQINDLRHGAREGIRLVAVASEITPDHTVPGWTNGERLAQATCERMDQSDGVTISIGLTDHDGNGEFDIGDDLTVTASKDLDQLTRMFDPILDDVVLEESVSTRFEQAPPTDGSGNDDVDGTTWTCA